MRIALKPVTARSTTFACDGAKPTSVSFFDFLARAASGAVQDLGSPGASSEADLDTCSDSRKSGQGEPPQSTAFKVEGTKSESGLIEPVMTTPNANATLMQDGQAANSSQSQSAQHCPGRLTTQLAQSKAGQAADNQCSNAILSITGQFEAAQPADLKAASSLSASTADSQAKTGEERFNRRQLAEITAIAGDRALQEGTYPTHGLTGAAVPASGMQTLLNAVQPFQDPEADAAQCSLQTPEAQNSSDKTAGAQVLLQGFMLPATPGLGNIFIQGTFASDDGNPSSKSDQFRTASATFGVNSISVMSTNAASASKSVVSQDTGTALGGVQASGQSSQHFQEDVPQAIAIGGKLAEGCTTQLIACADYSSQSPTGQSRSVPGSADSAPFSAQESKNLSSDHSDGGTTAGTSGINTARLVQSISETAMRLGMHSAEFGDIAIRTSVSQQQLQAQISVDHSELGNAISAHIPLLQTKLGNDLGLNTSIEVNQAGEFFPGGQGQSSQQNQTPIGHSASAESVAPVAETDTLPIPAMPPSASDDRLDIRA